MSTTTAKISAKADRLPRQPAQQKATASGREEGEDSSIIAQMTQKPGLKQWEAYCAQRVLETLPRDRTAWTASARILMDLVPTATTTGLTGQMALAGLPSEQFRVIRTPKTTRTRFRRLLARLLLRARVAPTCAPLSQMCTRENAAGSPGKTTRSGALPPFTRSTSAAPAVPRMTAASSMKVASQESP